MEKLRMAEQEKTLLMQAKSFVKKFYRFPNYIYVGKVKFERDVIVKLVERLFGKQFHWYKRRKVVGQLDDAIALLQQA